MTVRVIMGPMRQHPATTSDVPAFRPLTTLDDLEAAVRTSFSQPVVIFKHSFTCGTSAEAHEELAAAVTHGAPSEWYLVDVRGSRPVSRAIADRFGIRHESPQVLLLAAGQVRWHASHYRVTRGGIDAALEQLANT